MNAPFRLPSIEFTKTTLANGLEVITRRQAHLPIVAVNLWYHVGSKNEERRQRGFAHLFEHLMFEGSEHYPGDFFQPLQRLGAGVNGSTSSDRTNYFVDIPSAHFELAVAMESDRMANLLPALTDQKLRVQKDVVKNEYRQNYANRPYGQVWRYLAEALYPPDHPYSWLTIGLMEDVEAATRDDVESFFRRFYVPANASLCLVGDLHEDQALAVADRYFGPIPGGAQAIRPQAPVVRLDADRPLVLRDQVELDRLYQVWPTVPHFSTDDASLVLLADVLARGRSSRLYQKMVVDTEVAQNVTAYHAGRELAGTFGVMVTLRPGRSIDQARELVLDELRDLACNGPSSEELDRVKNGRLAGFIYALDNVGGFGGVADRLNAYNTYLGDPGAMLSDLQRYLDADSKAIRDAAALYLNEKPSVVLSVLGRSKTTSTPDTPLDRSVRPTSTPALAFRPPRPEIRKLSHGAELWVIPRRDLPIISVSAVVPAGAGAHGPRQGGLASLTSSMLDEGTSRYSARQLALAAERLGTNLSASNGWDGSYVGFQCLSPHLEPSLELAAEMLTSPTFPQSEFGRVKAQTLAALRAERDHAEAQAQRAFLHALFPANHPYRVPSDGSESSVEPLTSEDLRTFHHQHYQPLGSAWIVAGDVDADEMARLLETQLCQWHPHPSAARPSISHDPGTQPIHPRIILVNRPGAPQAVVRVGHLGIPRLHPDFDHLLLFNQILGGQFTSRLNETLREKKGYTYGIRSQFDARSKAGPFWVSGSLESARLGPALHDLRSEVQALLDDRPPTDQERDDARRSLVESQPRQFETPSSLVGRFANLFLHGLPPDYYGSLSDRLDSVSVDSMLQAAHRHLHPDRFLVVVVADAETSAPGLEELGWGPVERVDESAES